MTKKVLVLAVALIISLTALTACFANNQSKPSPSSPSPSPSESSSPSPSPSIPDDEDDGKKEDELKDDNSILEDILFLNGLNLKGLDSAKDGNSTIKRIRYGSSIASPKWELAQWWSKYNLKDGTEVSLYNKYTLFDQSKKVEVDLIKNSILLELNASKEFDTYNNAAPSKWPHLLLEQEIAQPFMLKDVENLYAKLDFTLNKSSNKKGTNKGLHAQFAWFIYVVNKNTSSPGFGNFLWFGLNIFDSTSDYAASTRSRDTAVDKGNFIYTVGSKNYLDAPIQVGQLVSIQRDIIPDIKDALTVAQEKGFMLNTTFDDCAITGVNIGWEVFDRWDVSITIEKIGLNYL